MTANDIFSHKVHLGDKVRVIKTGKVGELYYCQLRSVKKDCQEMTAVLTNGELYDISEIEAYEG